MSYQSTTDIPPSPAIPSYCYTPPQHSLPIPIPPSPKLTRHNAYVKDKLPYWYGDVQLTREHNIRKLKYFCDFMLRLDNDTFFALMDNLPEFEKDYELSTLMRFCRGCCCYLKPNQSSDDDAVGSNQKN